MSLAGCANDGDEVQEAEGGNSAVIEGAGTMSIVLNYGAQKRANNEFEVGSAVESAIEDMTVYFFDEQNNLIGNVVPKWGNEIPSTGNVEKKVDVEVPANVVSYLRSDATKKAGIVVVLNSTGVTLPGYAEGTPETYAKFNAALPSAAADVASEGKFMMTSTNYLTTEPKEAAITLITSENVGVRGADAVTAKPVTVAVERVAAKVTVKAGSGNVVVLGWALNVTNKKFFPVKMLTPGFVENNALIGKYTTAAWPMATGWNAEINRRSHWAVDPNYAEGAVTTGSTDDFNLIDLSAAGTTVAAGTSLYCLENTFDETHQRLRSTTTAVIVAQFVPEDVTPGADNTWVRWDMQNFTAADFVNKIVGKTDVTKYYYKAVNANPEDDELDHKYVSLGSGDFEISASEGDEIKINGIVVGYTGKATVMLKELETYQKENKFYTLKEGEKGKEDADYEEVTNAEALIAQAIANAIGKDEPVVYKNGYCYYEVPIRHFNDTEVPCDMTTVNEPKHLGRYGIVRNNTYVLTVNAVKNPGKPVTGGEIVPEDKPDDNQEFYLDVDLEVLSWNIRNQAVEL